MSINPPITVLCLASYFKGTTFLAAAKNLGCRVLVVAREKLQDEPWPQEVIDEIYFMPSLTAQPDIIYAIGYLMRSEAIDRIVPLDDYDVPTAAALREHFRIVGMGETTTRHFRDKLAMRLKAQKEGFRVPAFTAVFNYEALAGWMSQMPPPWLLKPRLEAGAMGIKRVNSADDVWHWLGELGDQQSYFLLEQFVPGEVFHVDSIVWDGKVQFALAHHYLQPPIDVAHEGGVFVTRTMPRKGPDTRALLTFNRKLLIALGMTHGVSHTEFIKGGDGELYFLETAARVGGANIEQLVEAAAGINLWAEWAKLEVAHAKGEAYAPPPDAGKYAGVLICLAKQEWPDLSGYQAAEITYRVNKQQHAGLIVAAADLGRVEALIGEYSQRFAHDFLAYAPPLDTAPT